MSLLDDVSIVVTPNGYKAGELYAVIPVPTEGSELVEDGSFPSGTSNWSEGTGWSLTDGYANASSASGELSQSGIDFDTSKRYYIQYTISGYSGSGGVKARFKGLAWNTGVLREENGTFTEVLMSTVENTVFSFVTSSSFTGSISNVSVKEYTSADMDVTRATAATRVDENGLVNYAEVLGGEEVTNGDFATDTDWTKGSAWSISGNNANFDDSTNSGISQSMVFTASKTYKVDFEITSGSGSIAFLSSNGATTYVSYATYGVGTYSVEFNYTTGSGFGIFGSSFLGGAFSITNVSVKEVTRDNVPRIDYTGGGCPHILAEPQRTNLIPYSEEISQYSETNTTVIDDDTTSPDGTVNASKVTKDGVNSNDRVYINNFIILNDTDYSLSVFIKNDDIVNGGVSTISARISGGTLFRQGYEWNGSILSITSSQASGTRTNVLLEDYGNGWWKVGFSFTSDGTSADIEFDLDRINGTDTTSIFLWGVQLEVGSYTTSYIPNFGTAAGVTRNQDIFTRDGIGSLINSTEGVLFVEMAALSNDSTRRAITLSDGTTSNRVMLRYQNSSNAVQCFINVSNALFSNLNENSYTITDFLKIAFKWKAGDFALWINGTEVAVSADATSFGVGVLTEMQFNEGDGAGSEYFGKVKQLQVYDTSLSDEQLLQLTGESGTDFYESYAEMASALTYTIQ